MASVEIVPITQDHIESFHRSLDFVARERRYLAFLEAPPFEATRAFILNNIKQGYPQLVAVSRGQVVGWCDVVPNPTQIYAHVGVFGIALLPEFRQQGIGGRLIRRTLEAARDFGLRRVELTGAGK
jgi:GNAT superfamily N-acetyltransferase